MARIVVIGGIESTYTNAQVLAELGEEIVLFVTRGEKSTGWEGVAMIDESRFSFLKNVQKQVVQNHINDLTPKIRDLRPDFIYSLGWQQVYSKDLLGICPFIGIHESLLPEGAGPVPIANAILHDLPVTGITLFWLDGGVDTGPVIGQLVGKLDPRKANATELYSEAMNLGAAILRKYVPQINARTAPKISQDLTKRTLYQKIVWTKWSEDKVRRARVYPYA